MRLYPSSKINSTQYKTATGDHNNNLNTYIRMSVQDVLTIPPGSNTHRWVLKLV